MTLRRIRLLWAFFVVTLGVTLPCSSSTLREGTFIRDSEIEGFLRDVAEPILKVAGLPPKNLKLHLYFSSEVNAAATFDQSMLINTGLILRSDNVGQIASVIAHEIGHMALGHIVQRLSAAQSSMKGVLAALAVGAASAIAGAPGLGTAIMVGGVDIAQKSLLHYSRGQESAADQAAVRYLTALKWPLRDFYSLMQMLAKRELLSQDRQFEYMQTHPFFFNKINLD